MKDEKIEVGALFGGIGGIELGLERTGYFKTTWFVENNEFCQKVLRKHWKEIPIYGDIKEINFKKMPKVDMLTGGFPCQDISTANPKGKGIQGERSGLWFYYAKAIGILQPQYALIENVSAITHKGLDVVLANLAKEGYDAEWFDLRASDFGALHQRERIFIIAYRPWKRCVDGETKEYTTQEGEQTFKELNGGPKRGMHITNTNKSGCRETEQDIYGGESHTSRGIAPNSNKDRQFGKGLLLQRRNDLPCIEKRIITHDWEERIQRFVQKKIQGKQGFSWCKNVRRVEDLRGQPNIPKPLFRGTRDGVPDWMDRIASVGNAVVPQITEFIGEQIKEYDMRMRNENQKNR